MITMRWPFVLYPAPGSSSALNDWEVTTGTPALISRSSSVSERSRVTNPSMP